MGSAGDDCIKIAPADAAGCSETTVEIKIKTLDSQTFTLRVDKCVPVPELKEQIASVTGVLSEQQRLICRGKVLKDDQLLSAYHVEDGHTLHMIVRQPVAPSSELSDHAASDPASSTGNSPGSRVGPGMLVGTFNISEQGDGAFPDLNRIVSAVLNSFGVSRFGSGTEGIDLNQPPLERLSSIPGLSGTRNFSRQHTDQSASSHVPVEPLQPPIIPDSLTTLSQYLSHLRQEFVANAGGHSANARSADLESEASAQNSEARGLLTPESLAEVMSSTRQLLVEQATECLSQLATQLESHSSVPDPLERSRIQSNALRSGALFQNLGALLLELGRTMMTLRMGQSSGDALVNAGPAVFVSSTGPNPIMVQPLPFQPGASFGSVPVGTVQHSSGLSGASAAGTGFLPRNIDIRIRTGSLFPRREQSSSQPQGEASAPVSSNNANSTSNQQESAAAEANLRSREPQVRAIPIRTVVAAVPASVARSSDSSRGSIGILYPVLARVQHMSSGNSNGTTTQAVDVDQLHDPNGGNSEQPGPDSSDQQPNAAVPGGNGNNGLPSELLNGQEFTAQIRGGLEHLLSSIFPGEHVQSHPEPTQESGSAVRDQGLVLSNILRHIIPIVSDNIGAESNGPTSGGANPDETQADGNPGRGSSSRRRRGPQSHPNSKRPRREQ